MSNNDDHIMIDTSSQQVNLLAHRLSQPPQQQYQQMNTKQLQAQYERFENIIKHEIDKDLLEVFTRLTWEIEEISAGRIIEAGHIQLLFGNFLPKYIKTLITKRYLNYESDRQLLVTKFLNTWLQYRIPALSASLRGEKQDLFYQEQGNISKDLELIEALFNSDNEYYNHRVSKNTPDIEDKLSKIYDDIKELEDHSSQKILEVAKVRRPQFTSYYLAHNINVFAIYQGFEVFLQLVKQPRGSNMFKICLTVLSILGQIKNHFIDTFWAQEECYGKVVTDVCIEFINGRCTPEDLRTASKKDITFFPNNIESLLDSIYAERTPEQKSDLIYKVSEQIELDIALRCLRIPILEKKLNGFQIIIQQIQKVRNGNKQTSALRNNPSNTLNLQALTPKRWLNKERLLEWFDSHKIFDLIFGDSLHSECIKKSYTILEFLYQNGKIQKREFDKMWECATKKHEAYKVGILKALAFVATKAKIEDLKYLFIKLRGIPMTEVDKFCLDLMKAIAKKLTGDDTFVIKESKRNQNPIIGPLQPQSIQRSNSLDKQIKSGGGATLQRRGSLPSINEPKNNEKMMKEHDFNVNTKDIMPPMKTLLGRKNAMAGQDSPMSDSKQKKNKSLSPTAKKSQKFEETKEFEMKEMPYFNVRGNGLRNQRQTRPNQDLNPLEVPAEKEDKNTADEDVSLEINGGDENGFGGAEIFNTSFGAGDNNEAANSNIPSQRNNQHDLEEEKGDHLMITSDGDKQAVALNLQILLQDTTLGLDNLEFRDLAQQVLDYYWVLCLENSVSQYDLSFQVHKQAIEDLTHILIFNYPKSILNFIGKCVNSLIIHQSVMSMQSLLHKLIANIQFPLMKQKQQLPKTRQELIAILDQEINLSNVCLSSYIEFKRLSLQYVFEQMGSQEHEQENLETQSSLDNDDERSNSTAQGQLDNRTSQPRVKESEISSNNQFITIQDEAQVLSNSTMFVSPRMKMEEEFKVPKNIRTQSFREEGNSITMQKAMSNPSVIQGQENFIQPQMMSGVLMQNPSGGAVNRGVMNSQTKRNRGVEAHQRQENGADNLIQQPVQQNNAVNRDFLNDLVTNQVYHYSYYEELHIRLDFMKFLVGSSPQILKPQQLQILWECLVNNAFYERERDQFFNWCTQILKTSLSLPQKQPKTSDDVLMMASESIFNDDCMELLFFETLLKLDFRYITEVMYECFERYFLYINEQYGQIVTNSVFESAFEVYETKLIGVEALWEILLCARNPKVYKQATEFLHKLYKKMSPTLVEKLNEIKEDLLVTCMDQIKTGYNQIRQEIGDLYEVPIYQFSQSIEDPKNRIARSISQLCKFIDEFEGLRDKNANSKLGAADREILVKCNNQMGSSPTPKQINLTRPISTKIGLLREEIASAVFPKRTAKEISLMHKGKDLNEDLKTLKDLPGIGPNDQQIIMIISLRNQYELDMDTMKEDTIQNDEALTEVVNSLKAFMCDLDLSDAVIKLACKKCNLDLNEAMMMLLEEDKVIDLQEEVKMAEQANTNNNIILIEESKVENADPNEEAKINLIISNRKEYFDLLFELLNLGINEITNAAWNLLIQIPVNKTLLNQIRTLTNISIGGQHNWCYIIDPSNSYKMLYSIQIVNSLISVNNEKLSEAEIQERYEWRLRFLELGGFEHLYNILITSDPEEFLGGNTSAFALKALSSAAPKKKSKSTGFQNVARKVTQQEGGLNSELKKDSVEIQNNQAKCLGYLISIVKIFIQAALLTSDEDKLLTLINQSSTSPFRKPKNIKSALQSVPENKLNQLMFGQAASTGGAAAVASDGENSSVHTPKFQSSNSSPPQSQTPNPQENPSNDVQNKSNDDPMKAESLFASMPGVKGNENQLYTQVDDFPRLVEQISGNIAQNMLEKVVNFNALISKLLSIIYKAVMFSDSPEISSLVQNSLDLLLPCIVWKPSLLMKEIYEFENLESLLIRTLLKNSNENVRKSIERTFKIICNEDAVNQSKYVPKDELMNDDSSLNKAAEELQGKLPISPKVYILKILLLNLPDTNEKTDYCEEFFNLITYLMKQCQQNFKKTADASFSSHLSEGLSSQQIKKSLVLEDGETFSALSLFQWCIYSLKNRPTYEDRYTQYTDKVLAGYLQLTQSLLEINQDLKQLTVKENINLVKTVFDFLFLLPSMEEQQSKIKILLQKAQSNDASADAHPKCKKKMTRKKAFNLLLTLCQNQEQNFVQLLQELYEFHSQIQSSQKVVSYQDFDGEVGMRSSSGFVGLKNFGCTCYMNALIQQLFMISDLRKGILESDVSDPDLDNSVLYQMKLIFANLQESEKQYYAPTGFTKAFKFFGEPVNVRQQQDTYEFLSMLFDTLEENLKNTPLQSHLKDTLGGLIGNETRSMEEEYPYLGEREEPFFAIQLDIKNKKNLGEALDLFIKPDHLDGDNKYMCEKYDRKVDATRRSYIKKLRNTVIINLKRFDFDYNNMQRLKLNDFCEFPDKINFKPWTKEGIQEREKQLKKKSKVSGEAQNNISNVGEDMESLQEQNIPAALYEDGSVYDSSDSNEVADIEMHSANGGGTHGGALYDEDLDDEEEAENMNLDTVGKYFDVEDFNDIAEEEVAENVKKTKSSKVSKNAPHKSKIEEKKHGKGNKGKFSRQKTLKDDSYYEYELVGVLVHSGSADAGHYYSFIKDRQTFTSNRWLEFNDTYVREFDAKNLGTECFGGEQTRGIPTGGGMLDDFNPADARMFERCRNAYLLFYERVNPIKEEQPLQLLTPITTKKFINGIESTVYQRIWEENAAFMKLKLFFDSEYFSFARDYINLYNFENILFFQKDKSSSHKFSSLVGLKNKYIHEQATQPELDIKQSRAQFIQEQQNLQRETKSSEDSDIYSPGVNSTFTLQERIEQEPGLYAIKLATILSQDIIMKVKDVQSFVQWLQLMDQLYAKNSLACVWLIKYLTENQQMWVELLIETQYFEVRESFAKLLTTAICVTAKNEESYFEEYDDALIPIQSNLVPELTNVQIPRSAVIRFMEQFFSELMLDKTLRLNWRRFDEYFQVLASFSQIGFQQMKYLVHKQNAIMKLLEFLMNSLSPFASSKLRMGDKVQQANFTQPLELLTILIRSCFTPGIKEQKQYSPESLYQTEDKHLDYPFDIHTFPLFTPECFTNDLLVNALPKNDSLMKIVVHLSWGDLNISTFFIEEIMSNIRNRRSIKDIIYQMKILSSLMNLSDDLLYQRLNMVFQFIEPEPTESAFSGINTSSLGLSMPSLRKSFFKFLEQQSVTYGSYVYEILNFFGEQACIIDKTGQILTYMMDHKQIYQKWVQAFLISHVHSNNKFTESQAQVDHMNQCIQNYKHIFNDDILPPSEATNVYFGSQVAQKQQENWDINDIENALQPKQNEKEFDFNTPKPIDPFGNDFD